MVVSRPASMPAFWARHSTRFLSARTPIGLTFGCPSSHCRHRSRSTALDDRRGLQRLGRPADRLRRMVRDGPVESTRSTAGPSRCSARPRSSRRSTFRKSPIACATPTVATRTARAACWPAGWSRRASVSCPFTIHNLSAAKGSGGWDTHGDNFNQLRNRLLPSTDLAVPTLIEDLKARGLLEETLVVWMGEFGRSPKVENTKQFGPRRPRPLGPIVTRSCSPAVV